MHRFKMQYNLTWAILILNRFLNRNTLGELNLLNAQNTRTANKDRRSLFRLHIWKTRANPYGNVGCKIIYARE
jgi:hypothetical protein